MRKFKLIALTLMLAFIATIPGVMPAVADETLVTPNNLIVFKIGDYNYYKQNLDSDNITKVKMDAAPVIKQDRTFVPVRFLGHALGVNDDNIKWNAAARTATLTGKAELKLKIGQQTIVKDGQEKVIDVAPQIVPPGRTVLPARYVAEGLGFKVDWDAEKRLVICYPEGTEKPDMDKILEKIKNTDIDGLPAGYEKPEWTVLRNGLERTFYVETEPGVSRYFRFVCTSHPELNYLNTYDWNGNPIVTETDVYTTTYILSGGKYHDIPLKKGMVITFDVYEKINGVEYKVDTIVETL